MCLIQASKQHEGLLPARWVLTLHYTGIVGPPLADTRCWSIPAPRSRYFDSGRCSRRFQLPCVYVLPPFTAFANTKCCYAFAGPAERALVRGSAAHSCEVQGRDVTHEAEAGV